MTFHYHITSQQRHLCRRQTASKALEIQFNLAGQFAPAQVLQALAQLMANQDSLRTRFIRKPEFKMPLAEVIDLTQPSIDSYVQMAFCDVNSASFKLNQFPLDRLPLFKLALEPMSPTVTRIQLKLATILCDQAAAMVLRELFIASLHDQAMEEPAVQYDQYADWQNEVTSAGDEYSEEGSLYWADRPLPTPSKLPDWLYLKGAELACVQKYIRTDLIIGPSSDKPVPSATSFFCAFQLLRQRFELCTHNALWYRSTGRNSEDLQTILGRFDKFIAIDLGTIEGLSWRAMHQSATQKLTEADNWADFFEPEITASNHSQIHPTLFDFIDAKSERTQADAQADNIIIDDPAQPFQLKLTVTAEGEGFSLELKGNQVQPAGLRLLLDSYAVLLLNGIATPETTTSQLQLFSRKTPNHLIQFNARDREPDGQPPLIHQAFASQAHATPQGQALIFAGESFSYRTLDERANQLAHLLIEQGLKPDQLVGICLDRGPDWIWSMLAVLKAGGAFLPFNLDLADARLTEQIQDAKPFALIGSGDFAERFPQYQVIDPQAGETLAKTAPVVALEPQNLAYALFTSGSTGKPKAVMVAHQHLANYVAGAIAALDLKPQKHFGLFASLNADLGFTMVMPALTLGGCLHLFSAEAALQPDVLAEALTKHPIDYLKIVPSHLQALLDEKHRQILPRECLILGGEATREALLTKIKHIRPTLRVLNHYGPTETCVGVLTGSMTHPMMGSFPLGKPLGTSRISLQDANGLELPVGIPGQIIIGGDTVARGYLNRPGLTALNFRPDHDGKRCYFSGDRGIFNLNGQLFFRGRQDHQVKIHGHRVELGEIEALLKALPQIDDLRLDLQYSADQHPQLIAYWIQTAATDPSFDPSSHATDLLLTHMRPMAWVRLRRFPITAHGKLDRQALPKPLFEHHDRANVGAQTPVQATLVKIWADVLNRPHIGIHDNFFQQGGDSILSIQIMAAAKQAGLYLVPKQIFDHPTIAQLAEFATVETVAEPLLEPDRQTTPLTPIQTWFFDLKLDQPQFWSMLFLAKASKPLDADQVKEACQSLFDHHAGLRMVFPKPGAEASYLARGSSVGFQQLVTQGGQAECEAAIKDTAFQAQHTMDLAHGPLFKVIFFDFNQGQTQRLLFIAHHLVVDAVSWRILAEDFATIYQNPNAALPQVAVSFQARSRALHSFAKSTAMDEARRFWDKAPREHKLPIDLANGSNLEMHEIRHSFELTADETRDLVQFTTRAFHCKIDEVLVTALVTALSRWSQTTTVIIDMEGHGRQSLGEDHHDLSRTIGWFTTHFPIVFEAKPNLDDSLKAIKEQIRQIPLAGLPYGLLELAEPRLAKLQPEISFNYWGQLDHSFTANSLLKPAPESAGPMHHPDNQRPYLLRFNAQISEQKLQFALSYSCQHHQGNTIERLADDILSQLSQLRIHSQSQTWGGHTPSDFPLAHLSQKELTLAISQGQAQIQGKHQVADIYRLTPIQAGILFKTVLDSEQDVYFRQMSWEIQGSLNRNFFEQAWRSEIQSHDIFRSGFFWEALPHPVQIVFKTTPLTFEFEDWRDLSDTVTMLEDKRKHEQLRGFKHNKPPLMRMVLIQTQANRFHFIWSYHHLILDGWSKYYVLRRVYQTYAGLIQDKPTPLPTSLPFRDFIGWIADQDQKIAAQYWHNYLHGFTGTSPLKSQLDPPKPRQFHALPYHLDTENTAVLVGKARRYELTMNTLIQGAWSLILGFHGQSNDICFGNTVSGRPAHLPGVETIVGPFINTQPVRVLLQEDQSLIAFLKQLQSDQSESRAFEFASLTDIKTWWDAPGPPELFDSLVIFYNYPKSNQLHGLQPDIHMGTPVFIEETDFKLGLVATVSDGLQCGIRFDQGYFTTATIQTMLDQLDMVLHQILADENVSIQSIRQCFGDECDKNKPEEQANFQDHRLKKRRKRRPINITGGV